MAQQLLTFGASVPPLFASEIHNTLAVAVLRKRVTLQRACEIADALSKLPLRFETDSIDLGSCRVIEVARQLNVSAYDATYIVLAQRLEAKLMTRDKRVSTAARALKVLWEEPPSRAL